MRPQGYQVLIPGTNKCYLIWQNMDFADVIKFRILRGEDYFGSSGRALNVITSLFIRGKQRDIEGDLTAETEGNMRTAARCYALGFEDGGMQL